MNRRKLFSGLGLGAIATLLGAGKAKAEMLPVANQDDIWVMHTCSHAVSTDGKFMTEPSEPIEYMLFPSEPHLQRAKEKYDKNMALYNDSPKCGTVYRRVYGTLVACPKCGGYTDVEYRDAGILVG